MDKNRYVLLMVALVWFSGSSLAARALHVRHDHDPWGSCTGELTITPNGVRYHSEDKKEHSREWAWTDIQTVDRLSVDRFSILTYEDQKWLLGRDRPWDFTVLDPEAGGLTDQLFEVIRKNELTAAYLRPVAFRGLGGFGLSAETPIDVAVAAWPMGPYLGPEALEQGITACVSSWQRFAPNTVPAGAKAGGNYLSGQLVAREARRLGFGEGIALASTGLLSEGAGENLFLVFDGVLHTTPASASILTGITRDTIKVLAREDGIEVVERDLPREYLYLADEVLMCGTAAEITPIRSIDGKQVGAGKAGRVTRRLQELYFGLFSGKTHDKWGWLEPV